MSEESEKINRFWLWRNALFKAKNALAGFLAGLVRLRNGKTRAIPLPAA